MLPAAVGWPQPPSHAGPWQATPVGQLHGSVITTGLQQPSAAQQQTAAWAQSQQQQQQRQHDHHNKQQQHQPLMLSSSQPFAQQQPEQQQQQQPPMLASPNPFVQQQQQQQQQQQPMLSSPNLFVQQQHQLQPPPTPQQQGCRQLQPFSPPVHQHSADCVQHCGAHHWPSQHELQLAYVQGGLAAQQQQQQQQQQAAPLPEQHQPAMRPPLAPPCFNWAAANGAAPKAYFDKTSTAPQPPASNAAPQGGRDGTVRLESLEFNAADLQALLWPDSTKQTEVGATHWCKRAAANCSVLTML